jgi:hypothetical protein
VAISWQTLLMGTTFVEIDGTHGFWMNDGVLELFLRLLALHIKEPSEQDRLPAEIRDDWLLASRGFFVGCVPVMLDKHLSAASGKEVVVSTINSLKSALQKVGPVISKDALNLFGFVDSTWTKDFETHKLIEVADVFLELIDGKITQTCDSARLIP